MKPTKKEIICYGAVVIWAIGCFAFLNFFYHYHFFYQEQNQLFLLTKDYVSSYLSDGPGWLARLTGDFLTQFYYYLFLGPAILTVSLLCIGDFTRRLLQNLGVPALAPKEEREGIALHALGTDSCLLALPIPSHRQVNET